MQDSQSTGPKPASRRGFFVGAATLGAAAAAVKVLPNASQPSDATAAAPTVQAPPERGGGYSLSEHVKRYYKTASA